MALCSECDSKIEYIGNGFTKNYTVPFEYDDREEVKVSVYNFNATSYQYLTQGFDYTFVNATTIRINSAPDDDATITIYRCTDLSKMDAVFAAGNAIKAADLNNNFDQLRYGLQEAKCNIDEINTDGWDKWWLNRIDANAYYKGHRGDLVKSTSNLLLDDDHVATTKWIDNRYWDQCNETTYSDDRWFDHIDDVHVPTTQAVEKRLAGFEALTGVKKVTGEMQRDQRWDDSVTNDVYIPTTDASVERFDHYYSDTNTKYPTTYWLQPGKVWVNGADSKLYYRNSTGYQWVELDTQGEQGLPGEDGVDGTAATIAVGTTTTGDPGTEAIVENVGTSTEAIFNFTIPRGLPGTGGGGSGELTDITAGNGIEVDKVVADIPKVSVKFGTSSDATTTVMPFNTQLLNALP